MPRQIGGQPAQSLQEEPGHDTGAVRREVRVVLHAARIVGMLAGGEVQEEPARGILAFFT